MIQRLPFLALVLAFAALLAPASAARAADAPVEGVHYAAIPGGRPLQAEPGKVEVVEVFAYWCRFCAEFEPKLAAWQRRQPDDVAFRYLPAAFTREDNHARAYFAAESLGALDRTHAATFRAVHVEQSLPARGASVDEIAAFHAGLGLDRAQVAAAMRSPQTDARMDAARAFAVATGVRGTPSLVVNGRYRVLGNSFEELLRNTDLLVAHERAALSRP